jgi:hypothetical protein
MGTAGKGEVFPLRRVNPGHFVMKGVYGSITPHSHPQKCTALIIERDDDNGAYFLIDIYI